MKRFQVLKLFNTKTKSEISGWKDINESMPTVDCIVKVKLHNGNVVKAMFFLDKCSWIAKYNLKTSYFWDYKTEEPLENVTHWDDDEEENDN